MLPLTLFGKGLWKKRSPEGRGAAAPHDHAPLAGASYVVFDTELTGLDPREDSLLSIGAVRMKGNVISLGETFHRMVSPRSAMKADSVVIHQITPGEVAGSPDAAAVLPEFMAFCGDDILVGHMVSIDLHFINKEMERLDGGNIGNPAVDTFSLYQFLKERENSWSYTDACVWPGDLLTVAGSYGIRVSGAHNALMDAFITAQVFQRMMDDLRRGGILTLGELLRRGKPWAGNKL